MPAKAIMRILDRENPDPFTSCLGCGNVAVGMQDGGAMR